MDLEAQEKKKGGKRERERETPDALDKQPIGQIQFQRQGEICEERSPSSRICRPSMYERAFWQTTIIIMFHALPRNFSPCRCKYFSNSGSLQYEFCKRGFSLNIWVSGLWGWKHVAEVDRRHTCTFICTPTHWRSYTVP